MIWKSLLSYLCEIPSDSFVYEMSSHCIVGVFTIAVAEG